MEQKVLIVGIGALLVGMTLGWILGISSTQKLILNITNSSNQSTDEPSIKQPTNEYQGNMSAADTEIQDNQRQSTPQNETPRGNTSQIS